jgi:Fe-coproporphyrin III synthase
MAIKEIILFVTNKCNLNCSFCCNADVNKSAEELSLEDYKIIARTLPDTVKKVLISGGEPSLRLDLPEIIEAFYINNGMRKFDIPFNGFNPEKTFSIIKDIFAKCPKARVTLDISLDGFEQAHNKMRGNSGAFERTVKLLGTLTDYKMMGKQHFRIFINTVIAQDNVSEHKRFALWVRNRFPNAFHSLIIIRERDTKGMRRPIGLSVQQIREVKIQVFDNVRYYFRKDNILRRLYILLLTRMELDMIERTASGRKSYFKCTANLNNRVIYPDGNVSVCEISPPFANLKDFDFDFSKMEAHFKIYKKRLECSCYHPCFFGPSIREYPLNIVNYFLDLMVKNVQRKHT